MLKEKLKILACIRNFQSKHIAPETVQAGLLSDLFLKLFISQTCQNQYFMKTIVLTRFIFNLSRSLLFLIFVGDFSELSLQTETFAQKHGGPARSTGSPTSASMVAPSLDLASRSNVLGPLVGGSNSEGGSNLLLLSNNNRRSPSSYSSIVSSSNSNTGSGIASSDSGSGNSNMMLGAEIMSRRGPSLSNTSPRLPSGLAFPGDQDGLGRPATSYGPGGFGPFSESGLQGILPGGTYEKFLSSFLLF